MTKKCRHPLVVLLRVSRHETKKYDAVVGRKTVSFGARGMSDYTIHKDPRRMKNYLSRHRESEDWGKSGLKTAGFWSRWLLWNRPSFREAKQHVENKFCLRIKQVR